jgi:hypothetical protein
MGTTEGHQKVHQLVPQKCKKPKIQMVSNYKINQSAQKKIQKKYV